MPLGDSITVGWVGGQSYLSDGTGYRSTLWEQLVADGHDVTFVGGSTEVFAHSGPDPQPSFPLNHEGHSGYWSHQIHSNVLSWLTANPADIILLMNGTNDIIRTVTVQQAADDFEALLDRILTNSTAELVVAALPHSTSVNNGFGIWATEEKTDAFNTQIRALVASRQLSGKSIHLADLGPTLSPITSYIGDGVHPNVDGYELMASGWKLALDPILVVSSPEPATYLVYGLTAVAIRLKRTSRRSHTHS